MKKLLLPLVCFSLIFTSCEDKPILDVDVTAVALDRNAVTLKVNDTAMLTAKILPEEATSQRIKWTTDNRNVAWIDNGKITAMTVGTAVIYATSVNGKFDSCLVTVTPFAPPPHIPVTGVTLNLDTATIDAGGSITLQHTVLPDSASNKNVVWSSSNQNIATVVDGRVTGVAAGIATITVKTVDGDFTATCIVTVNAVIVPVTGVSLNRSTATLEIEDTLTLIPTILPANATNRTVTWESSAPDIATVAYGFVTAHSAGSATITVTTNDGGFMATCVVTVIPGSPQTSWFDGTINATVVNGNSYNSYADRVVVMLWNQDTYNEEEFASAPYVNGGFSMTLPTTPAPSFQLPFGGSEGGIQISNPNVMFVYFENMTALNGDDDFFDYIIHGKVDASSLVYVDFFWVDNDVTMTGTEVWEYGGVQYTDTYSLSLVQGWNKVYLISYDEYTSVFTTTPVAGVDWYFSNEFWSLSGSLSPTKNTKKSPQKTLRKKPRFSK
ncbi:MAG: Ig-like domain-containing protein [Bacteroidales bacterium]|nr:Ig-like domain-containing protein [Bacteroidales bacterium]